MQNVRFRKYIQCERKEKKSEMCLIENDRALDNNMSFE